MRVGGPNGIDLGGPDATVRAGSLVVTGAVRRPTRGVELGRSVAPAVSVTGVAALTSVAGTAAAVVSAGLAASMAAASAPRVLYVGPALLACVSAALFAIRKWVLPPIVERTAERRLLQLAAIRHGEFSLPDAALALGTSLEHADATLTSLAQRGHVDLRVDESNGAVRYRFRDVGHHHPR